MSVVIDSAINITRKNVDARYKLRNKAPFNGTGRDAHSTRFAQDLHKICTRFAQDLHKICTRFTEDKEC
ncbi:hypothetical protein DSM106972_041180 [Dulcicalothrix desertica PCC 7102]|uniref:Uncharacterized protein n=1 Tax=Dulcicalothrix desertica PCC 7102 TaxID=232991 RepID=A0A433VGT0_9CYAN|nr:hypothetical protein [Dulcicalothrix desertica]RUT05297.1 hypothetical protein DSM106972_041180 [Dulcicalothrix desertica PCC 7102]